MEKQKLGWSWWSVSLFIPLFSLMSFQRGYSMAVFSYYIMGELSRCWEGFYSSHFKNTSFPPGYNTQLRMISLCLL